MICTKHNQGGGVLIEAAMMAPIFFMLLFITCSISFVALNKNHILEEMQNTVRVVALSSGGSCAELAANVLREKINYQGASAPRVSVRTNDLHDGRIEINFQVELDSSRYIQGQNPEMMEMRYRVRIENPDGCSAA